VLNYGINHYTKGERAEKLMGTIRNPVGEILTAYRKHNKLTQKEAVEALAAYNDAFASLNAVTLSRWETGTTSPSLKKKKLLILFFLEGGCLQCDECRQITRHCFEDLYSSLHTIFTANYQYIIGNLPERPLKEYAFHPLYTYYRKQQHIEHIIDIEEASNVPNYYTVTAKLLERWCNHPATFAIIAERKMQHLGHFIMLKIKNEVARAIANYERSEFSLTEEDFCPAYERGTYYAHALYGSNPKIAAKLNVEAYLFMLDNMENIDNILIFSSRDDGRTITRNYGIEAVAEGYDEKLKMKWVGMLSPVEKILFSDTVLKLVF